jgi:hypothetical protein
MRAIDQVARRTRVRRGGRPPVVDFIAMNRSEHRVLVLPRFDHRLAAQPGASGEALPKPLAGAALDSRRNFTPGRIEVPQAPQGRRTDGTQRRQSPSARSIPQDGSREAGRLPVAERQAWPQRTYSVQRQWEAVTHETARSRAEAPVQGPLPRKATGEVRHDPPEGDRRDPSQLPHEEEAHPR